MTVTPAWTPVQIGEVELKHRVVLAPLTRGRATLSTEVERTSVPNELMEEYYAERATSGGLLISEASPVSIRASGKPGVPGLFTDEQQAGWNKVVDAVHAKEGVFFAQLWHQGRNTHSLAIGQQPISASAVAIDGAMRWNTLPSAPFETPKAMTENEIAETQDEFAAAATRARAAGFDGIELHAGNGYLFDQFLHNNINIREDRYGGSIPNRCRFLLETVDKVSAAIGSGRVAVRLTPFGLFNDTRGSQRVEQWTHLCAELDKKGLAYVHMIEPRFDEFRSAAEKGEELGGMAGGREVSLRPFRDVLKSTRLIVAGGCDPDSFQRGISAGDYDLVAFGRFFVSNPDLVHRLRAQLPLYRWDRSRFYGPFPDNEIGYTVHLKREVASSSDAFKAQLAG